MNTIVDGLIAVISNRGLILYAIGRNASNTSWIECSAIPHVVEGAQQL